MDLATVYGAWKMYKYISKAYATYETAVTVYGTACTVAATTGAVVGYVVPSWRSKPQVPEPGTCLLVEKDDDWEIVDVL